MLDDKLLLLLLFMTIPIVLRVRRDLGFQKVGSSRIRVRMVGLAMVSLLITAVLWAMSPVLTVVTWAISLSLLSLSLRTTKYEHRDDGLWFRANPWIGGCLVVLFVGRMGYRLYEIIAAGGLDAMADGQPVADDQAIAALERSPLSLTVVLLLISYHAMYYLMVSRYASKLNEREPSS